MEILDIYDKYRQKTGRIHERGNPMKDGDYHIVVHVWIVNDKGEFLIQKRQPWKIGWPNMWDCSAAGAAIHGETSKEAAIRETKEEIGIDLNTSKADILLTVKFSRGFDDIWLVRQNVDKNDLKLQYEEVADAKWVSYNEIKQMVKSDEFIEYHYLDILYQMINSPIALVKTGADEAEELLAMQKEVFMPLYIKYQDHETSPVNNTVEKLLKSFDIGDYYKILYDDNLAGSVFVYEKEPGIMKFQIINIRKEYENKGIAQEVMNRLELIYAQAESWELEAILSEKRNCYLYEKMGYVQIGKLKHINDKLTIVSYKKQRNLHSINHI